MQQQAEIRPCRATDSHGILALVNEAAAAYEGVIPADRWKEPYMDRAELEAEIADGVVFWALELGGDLLGVMGIQDRGEVALVRHAYVRPARQRAGIGTMLLRHLEELTDKPLLVGTWADATWAIEFYRRNGFGLVAGADKDDLLRRYWSIPERQIETSVVLKSR